MPRVVAFLFGLAALAALVAWAAILPQVKSHGAIDWIRRGCGMTLFLLIAGRAFWSAFRE